MASYETYPAVDETYNFPPEVRQAIAASPEVVATMKTEVPAAVASSIASDATIRQAAIDAMTNAAVIEALNWYKGSIPENTNLNTVQKEGLYSIVAFDSITNEPRSETMGALTVERIAASYRVIQKYTTNQLAPQTWTRLYDVGTNTWYPWVRTDATAEVSTMLRGNENLGNLSAGKTVATNTKYWEVRSPTVANDLNLPTNSTGYLQVYTVGTIDVQQWTVAEGRQSIWMRSRREGEAYSAWLELTPETPAMPSVILLYTNDIDNLSENRLYWEVRSSGVADAVGLPTSTTGVLKQYRIGTIRLQQWIVGEGEQRIWTRSVRQPNAWSPWLELTPAGGNSVQSSTGHGTKVIPLPFSLPGSNVSQTKVAGTFRQVRKWPHMPRRIRVHIMNRNSGHGTPGGATELVGLKVGKATEAGVMSNLVTAVPAGAIPFDGSVRSGPWIDSPAGESDWLGITGVFNNGTIQQMEQAGGWYSDGTTGWDRSSPVGSRAKLGPFHIFIEAEIPARVPVVAVLTDSIGLGTSTLDPAQTNWPMYYSESEQSMPLYLSQHGSSLKLWGEGSTRWTSIYPGIDLVADAVVNALGQNDLNNADVDGGLTLVTLKERFDATMSEFENRFPGIPIFLATVTPSSSKTPAVDVLRRQFNSWLKTKPRATRGVLDFSATIGNATDDALGASYVGDGIDGDSLHPNTAGQKALGNTTIAAKLTPFALTDAQIRALV